MTMKPLISVVIPVFNRAGIVTRTLDSVAAQTLRPLALVIVDNNSTDDTLDVISRWASQHQSSDFTVTVLSEHSPGACSARNRGLDAVDTPYVMFFDSDDVMHPWHVASFADALTKHPDADVVGHSVRHHFLSGRTKILRFARSLYSHIFHASFSTQRYAVCTAFIRQVGGWDESLRGWDDYELGIRLLLASPRIVKAKGPIGVDTYQQETSITGIDYSSDPHKWEDSLDRCTRRLSDGRHAKELRYIELRRVILAADYHREKSTRASILLDSVLSRESNPMRHAFYRFAFRYVAAGGRGIALTAPIFLR